MAHSRIHFLAIGLFCTLTASPSIMAQPLDRVEALRRTVIEAKSPREKAEGYKDLFQKLGRKRLPELMKDADTGIALQAAWEMHTKVVKRPKPLDHHSDEIYDPAELAKFVAFLKDRTKAPVPKWWAESILDIDAGSKSRAHHINLYSYPKSPYLPVPKREYPKSKEYLDRNSFVADDAEIENVGDRLIYKTADGKVEFPKVAFKGFVWNSYLGIVGDKRSVIAKYYSRSAFGFGLIGLEGKGGEPSWKNEVWAVDHFVGTGPSTRNHWVELKRKDDTVYVFGAGSSGMYVEAFDIATGECRYRFCTRYWLEFSENWD